VIVYYIDARAKRLVISSGRGMGRKWPSGSSGSAATIVSP
jgi:hypothetical protein